MSELRLLLTMDDQKSQELQWCHGDKQSLSIASKHVDPMQTLQECAHRRCDVYLLSHHLLWMVYAFIFLCSMNFNVLTGCHWAIKYVCIWKQYWLRTVQEEVLFFFQNKLINFKILKTDKLYIMVLTTVRNSAFLQVSYSFIIPILIIYNKQSWKSTNKLYYNKIRRICVCGYISKIYDSVSVREQPVPGAWMKKENYFKLLNITTFKFVLRSAWIGNANASI